MSSWHEGGLHLKIWDRDALACTKVVEDCSRELKSDAEYLLTDLLLFCSGTWQYLFISWVLQCHQHHSTLQDFCIFLLALCVLWKESGRAPRCFQYLYLTSSVSYIWESAWLRKIGKILRETNKYKSSQQQNCDIFSTTGTFVRVW